VPVAVTALRGTTNERAEFLLTTLPVTDLNAPVSSDPGVFPHYADGGGWTTQIMLVNPTAGTISGTLDFRNGAGQSSAAPIRYTLPPRSARPFTSSGQGAAVRAGYVVVSPDPGSVTPAGSLVFSFSNGGVRVTEGSVALSAAASAFRLYGEASEDGSMQSGIAIANPNTAAVLLTLDLIDANGATTASTRLTLDPLGQRAVFLNQLPGFGQLRLPFQGLIRISGSSAVNVIGLRGRTNERGDFLIATTPPIAESGSATGELFFPHFADSGGYTTEFILFSAGAGPPISGNLQFFSQAGQPLAVKLK
jgi:hypothetical protein